MDTLNSAIENLMTSSSKEDWPSVNMNVADATVTVISEKVGSWRKDRLAWATQGEGVNTMPFHKTQKLSQSLTSWGLYCRVIKVAYVYGRFGALSVSNCAFLETWIVPS